MKLTAVPHGDHRGCGCGWESRYPTGLLAEWCTLHRRRRRRRARRTLAGLLAVIRGR